MHPAAQDPWHEVAQSDVAASIAVISLVEGPAYRSPGTAMAFFVDGRQVGALTAGCIEDDVALHARAAMKDGVPRRLRYGEGSPFFDLKLPCGGALEITIVPNPARDILQELDARRARREAVSLFLDPAGALSLSVLEDTSALRIDFAAPVSFVVLGAGPEAIFFADLVRATGAPHVLYTPEKSTLSHALASGCCARLLKAAALPDEAEVDARTAVVLFFHDHDWEPPILMAALGTPAFYIGAQGSKRTQQSRTNALTARGVSAEACARLRGPIGLIPSVRDPKLLAISVLAEVMALAAAPDADVERQ